MRHLACKLGLLAVAALLIPACSDLEQAALSPDEKPVLSVTSEMDALGELTRAMALALADVGLRQRLLNDMRNSRFTHEHKIHLGDYVRGNSGGILLAKIAQHTELTPDRARALIDRLPPLEMYMPVQQHRERWRGGDDLIVAASLTEDDTPIGYDLSGRPVELSPLTPPEVPTIVLVPVETDFSRPLDTSAYNNVDQAGGAAIGTWRPATMQSSGIEPQTFEPIEPVCPEVEGTDGVSPTCGGGGGPGGGGGYTPPSYPAGIYMEEMIIYDKREPWTRGDPEIEIHTYGTIRGLYQDIAHPNDPAPVLVFCAHCTQEVQLDCAGEEASGYRYFNFNGENGARYSKTVLFGATERFAPTEVIRSNHATKVELVRRRVPVEAPFRVYAVERDDGRQCPDAPRKVKIEFKIEFNWFFGGLPVPNVDDFGWEDVLALFGGNNDPLGNWSFSSFDALEALNGTWRYSPYADVKLNNRGFDRSDIPPYWEERYW